MLRHPAVGEVVGILVALLALKARAVGVDVLEFPGKAPALARPDIPAVPPQAGRLYIDSHTVEEMLVLMECLNDRGRRSLADYLRYLTQDAGNRS